MAELKRRETKVGEARYEVRIRIGGRVVEVAPSVGEPGGAQQPPLPEPSCSVGESSPTLHSSVRA